MWTKAKKNREGKLFLTIFLILRSVTTEGLRSFIPDTDAQAISFYFLEGFFCAFAFYGNSL